MKPKVGFVINGRIPSISAVRHGMNPLCLFKGWDDAPSPMSEMRFRWIARHANRFADYRLYRMGEKYQAVVFVKSMTDECRELAARLRERATKVIFDANVDYYTVAEIGNMPRDLIPTESQRTQAVFMTESADMVIASSRHLAGICGSITPSSRWIPDNIEPSIIPEPPSFRNQTGVLELWWSGMPQKTIDLLALEAVLPRFGSRIRLNLVTGDLPVAMDRMDPAVSGRLRSLFSSVNHEIHRYRSVSSLLQLYASRQGVIISPRFLDNPYNLSHSEWKITLGMACGLPAITSPQPSYLDVRERCGHPSAITICSTAVQWVAAFEEALKAPLVEASAAAREVVLRHYSTPVVASAHVKAVKDCLEE